jgi:hypothetical protein
LANTIFAHADKIRIVRDPSGKLTAATGRSVEENQHAKDICQPYKRFPNDYVKESLHFFN